MPEGLKQQLGLGEPKPQGSSAQADQFKAAFQAATAKINESLQYTAAYAEKAKHDPQAAKRDSTCQAFQVALGRIDPTIRRQPKGRSTRCWRASGRFSRPPAR